MSAGASTAPARPSASSALAERSLHAGVEPLAEPRLQHADPQAGEVDRLDRSRVAADQHVEPEGAVGDGPRHRAAAVERARVDVDAAYVDHRRTSASGRRCRTPTPASRTEPPVSVPGARSTSPAASATADPEEEPPGMRDSSCGLRTGGRPGVWPIIPHASWCIASLPTIVAPASRWRTDGRRIDGAALEQERRARVALHAGDREESLNATTRPLSGPSDGRRLHLDAPERAEVRVAGRSALAVRRYCATCTLPSLPRPRSAACSPNAAPRPRRCCRSSGASPRRSTSTRS